MAPIERLKVIFQTQGMREGTQRFVSPLQSLKLILREEGVRGLYKGNGANCLRVIPVYALKFSLNDTFTELASRRSSAALTVWDKIAAGSAAGVIQIALTYPLDLARAKLATSTQYRGMGHVLSSVYREHGFRGLYRGRR